MVLLLFGMALVIGILVGIGARSWTQQYDSGPPTARFSIGLSSEAVDLGYKSEAAYISDRDRASAAQDAVLASGPGAQRLWENPETGNRGVIWAAPEVMQPGGSFCRVLARRTLINGAYRNGAGTACRSTQGVWDAAKHWHNE